MSTATDKQLVGFTFICGNLWNSLQIYFKNRVKNFTNKKSKYIYAAP